MSAPPSNLIKEHSRLKSALKNSTTGIRNENEVAKSHGDRRHHTIPKDIPVLKAKRVPLNQKIRGFKKIRYQDQITVSQVFDDLHSLTGSRMSNVYSVSIPNRFSFDPLEQTLILYMAEKISCEMAWLKTAGRKLVFRVLNSSSGNIVAVFTRPCRPCFCFTNILMCCSMHKLDAILPDGRYFGSVEKVFNFFNPKYAIYNAEGERIYEVIGPTFGNMCPCWLISNSAFKVKCLQVEEKDFEEDDGKPPIFIQKSYTNTCVENNYTLSVDPMMSTKSKVLFLALIVLIDFQHFKRFGTTCHFAVWLIWIVLLFVALAVLFIYLVICETKGIQCDELQW